MTIDEPVFTRVERDDDVIGRDLDGKGILEAMNEASLEAREAADKARKKLSPTKRARRKA